MALEIRPLHPVFVGEVSGVDLTRPLNADEVAGLEAGMDRYAVLVYRGQAITDEQQIAFSQNFGKLELPDNKSNITKAKDRRLRAELADVSNLNKENKPYGRDDRQRMFNLGNQLWHSDSSFRAIPAKYSLLSGRRIPPEGGNTEFADMRAAYDALDAKTKDRIDDLVCLHSLVYSRGLLGFDALSEDEKANFTPVRQRLVRTHPVTGRKSLYLSAHAGAIEGWPVPEARALLRDLTEHATQREFVYAHVWRQHDLVQWDNRQTMHRARPFADTEEVRDVRRTTVAGDQPTIEQAQAA
ncbi:MAG: TauD/TfdA family dioxygenase [Alphaproteobacteria bacterium]|nr:TauD/TfdA family dioxygenase [Alphaproteobacteria bacterium]MCB9928298.1 TauD/TfdA family dioxygenase [Alphaproteobacteria bacterium]